VLPLSAAAGLLRPHSFTASVKIVSRNLNASHSSNLACKNRTIDWTIRLRASHNAQKLAANWGTRSLLLRPVTDKLGTSVNSKDHLKS
jgi:hypothetical protein